MNGQDPADAVRRFRREKDDFYRTNPESPIPVEVRGGFSGLKYFDYDPRYVQRVPLRRLPVKTVQVGTSDGDTRDYRRVGAFDFQLPEGNVTLQVYDTGHAGSLFLPFRDATSGKETYGAGRYIDLEASPREEFEVDFNLAYNPSCAYNEAYSCPLPPAENWAKVPIRAGVKTYE